MSRIAQLDRTARSILTGLSPFVPASAILSALSRPTGGCRVNSYLHNRLASSADRSTSAKVSRTVILEAEMVPYSERKAKIEEFWKITACAGDRRAVFNRPG